MCAWHKTLILCFSKCFSEFDWQKMQSVHRYILVLQLNFLNYRQVGDEIVEINREPARGISHTRAIDLIQAGGNKVVLLLRPGAGLAQDASEYII